MEKKSNFNLEKTKTTHFMIGFCFISSVVLATLSYGELEPLEKKFSRNTLENTSYLVEAVEKPPVLEQPKEKPQVQQQSTQKDEVIDLNNDITTNINNTEVVNNNPFVDFGLPKGDTTLIINPNPVPVIVPDKVEEFPDVEAQFPGGYEAWKKYLLKEIRYPEISIEMEDQGVVYISFVVDVDGTISDIKVTRGVSFDIDKEAKRVIKNSPKWVPGRTKNEPIKTRMSIPIKFIIN